MTIRRRYKILIGLLSFIIMMAGYSNCGLPYQFKLFSTTVGNPMNPTQASQEILFAICSVLDRCGAQVPFNVCMAGVPTVSGIGQRLGLAPGVDNPYSALENAESSGAIAANLTQSNTCVDTINNLSCNNINVQNAYNPFSQNPFAAVPFIVPVSACGQVFTPLVQSYACTSKVFLLGASGSLSPQVSGSTLTYSVTPALPAGLSLNSASGVISGTPTAITPLTPYTVTAGGLSNVVNIRTAQGYMVNDLSDLAYAGPGCVSTGGTCTLRAAIGAINAGASYSVVQMPQGQITLTLGTPLTPASSMDIYGDCAQTTTIDGNASVEIFNVVNSGNISFNFLTIQNGSAVSPAGGINFKNTGVATYSAAISNSVIQNNTGSGANSVGGVWAQGTAAGEQINLTISNSTFLNNQSPNAMGVAGGLAVYPFASASITNSTFISNTCGGNGGGGAILTYAGLTVTDSLFYNNSETDSGGTGGTGAISANGNVILTNDTFDANTSSSANGTGVLNIPGGTVNANNCTFANNSAGISAGVFHQVTSGNLANNIFYNNGSKNCITSTMTSLGGNLTDSTAADCGLTQTTDIVNTNALLGPLQNNGGSTQTMGLLPSSPAIDSANTAACPATDQRGYGRNLPTSCDIGSYEDQP